MLSEIEAKFEFHYPDVYKRLFEDGMLDWGETGSDWYKNTYPKIRQRPPFLVFASDFKLIPLTEIENTFKKIKIIDELYSLAIPFGKNGAGDIFCFLYDKEKQLNCICKFNKRTDISIKLNTNLEDFIFSQLLNSAICVNPDDFNNNKKIFIEDLSLMLKSHQKYLSPSRFKLLSEIFSREFIVQDEEIGAITQNETDEILERETKFDGFGEKISSIIYLN